MTTLPPRPHTTPADIAARLERLPNSRWQGKILTLLGIVTFFEGFDQLLVAYTMPLIRQEWNLGAFELTLAVTSGSVGMLLGALCCGVLADRLGRKRIIIASLLLTALASLLLMVSPNFAVFTALRFVQGFGIGGEVPVAAAFVSELSRAKGRGRFVLLYELAFPAGLAAAAVVSTVVVPAFGWRALYLIGALPALMAVPILKYVPESPRWLATRGDLERAEREMRWIERSVESASGRPLPEPDVTGSGSNESLGRFRELVGPAFRRRTAIVSTLWFCGYFINYGLTSWLPTIYTSIYGVPVDTALRYTLYTSLAGFGGCVVIMLLIDRIGRRASLVGGLGLGSLLLVVLALIGAETGVTVALWATLSAVFIFAVNICLYLYTAELYPTRMRALGISLGGAWNRIGVILGPVVVGWLVGVGATPPVVFAVFGAVGLTAALVALLGEETTGKRLEDISA
ncbi:MFS transporter [Prauserella alba]|uniref:MFS transporter n=1 Tax=Prauserella alba TaxID=176898 RepID=A0ABN1VCE9_9PSEU|nr:MFS transporter [Prauserella alba]MCP2178918.1 MFS transporter, putative metabolite:H+ symporter [Prauserella alba]